MEQHMIIYAIHALAKKKVRTFLPQKKMQWKKVLCITVFNIIKNEKPYKGEFWFIHMNTHTQTYLCTCIYMRSCMCLKPHIEIHYAALLLHKVIPRWLFFFFSSAQDYSSEDPAFFEHSIFRLNIYQNICPFSWPSFLLSWYW